MWTCGVSDHSFWTFWVFYWFILSVFCFFTSTNKVCDHSYYQFGFIFTVLIKLFLTDEGGDSTLYYIPCFHTVIANAIRPILLLVHTYFVCQVCGGMSPFHSKLFHPVCICSNVFFWGGEQGVVYDQQVYCSMYDSGPLAAHWTEEWSFIDVWYEANKS